MTLKCRIAYKAIGDLLVGDHQTGDRGSCINKQKSKERIVYSLKFMFKLAILFEMHFIRHDLLL